MDRSKNAKKLFCLLMTAVLLCLQAGVSCAATKKKWSFEYEPLENDTIRIVLYRGNKDEVVNVPEEIDGLPVSEIGKEAFKLKRNIRAVSIPDSVVSIGEQAFSGCDALESVRLPKELKSLGDKAFSNCKSLRSIVLPAGVGNIGYNPFNLCDNLTDVSFDGKNGNFEVRDGALIRKEEDRKSVV